MFRHIGIVVKDIKQQLKFYEELLGLEIYYEMIEKGSFLEKIIGKKDIEPLILKLGKNNKTIVELLYFGEQEKSNSRNLFFPGITHFAITVENLDEIYKNMKDQKINFISEPQISDDKKHKVCFCQDYESNYIELVQVLG